jgi:hypothetical protein
MIAYFRLSSLLDDGGMKINKTGMVSAVTLTDTKEVMASAY